MLRHYQSISIKYGRDTTMRLEIFWENIFNPCKDNRFHNGIRLLRCLIRGGNWNNGANAGVFNSNLNNARSNANDNIGGRAAFHLLPSGGYTGSGLRLTGRSMVYRLKGAFFRSAEDSTQKN